MKSQKCSNLICENKATVDEDAYRLFPGDKDLTYVRLKFCKRCAGIYEHYHYEQCGDAYEAGADSHGDNK